jgi:hypothetical protein
MRSILFFLVIISVPGGGLRERTSSIVAWRKLVRECHWREYLNLINTDFSRLSWPVRVWRYIDEDYDGIEWSHTSYRKDNVHVCDVITSDYFD